MRIDKLLTIILLQAAPVLAKEDFPLVIQGRAVATVHAPGENQWAGVRFVDRITRLTGVHLRLQTAQAVPAGEAPLVAIGSPEANPVVKALLEGDARLSTLGEQGYLVKVGTHAGRRVLAIAGQGLDGVNNAVSEVVTWRLRLTGRDASVPGDLDEADKPALKYRLLWNWDSRTNWRSTVEQMHAVHYQRYNLIEEGEVAFLAHFKRAIDYFSDHKLNGLIVWGFIRDDHGGLEAARELCRYGRRNNVRLLPGVCTEAAYGGFAYSKDSKFNLDHWTDQHPELRYKNSEGKYIAGICPSKPENQAWLRQGTRWFFEQLPDVGGMNLENGDWFFCWTEDCIEAKSKPENDPNFFWDQLASYKPVIETAREVRPDAWMIFASYTGFSEAAIEGAMAGAVKTKRALGLATEIVYPPRMLKQLPPSGVCQWTLTGMAGPHAWPDDLTLPPGNIPEHIGYIHQSGAVSGLSDPAKWWGTAPGSGYEEVCDIVRFVCSRIASTGMSGIAMYGERGAISPANDLNYLALEYFGWHPERTWEQFLKDRLSICYGGSERARQFLTMLRNTTRDPAAIRRDQERAAGIAGAPELDIRQQQRWSNLSDELARRAELAQQMSREDRDDGT